MKVGPEYHPTLPDLEANWAPEAASIATECENECRYWWTLFSDPVLVDLVSTASQRNLDLKAAAMRICRSRFEQRIAVGNLFPQKQDAFARYTRFLYSYEAFPYDIIHLGGSVDDWQLGLNLDWEIDFWGRYRRAIELANAELAADCFKFGEIMLLLRAEVASSYIEYRTMEYKIRLAQSNVRLQKLTVDLIRDRFNKGMVDQLDLHQANALLATTQAIVPELQASKDRARNRLSLLLDLPREEIDKRLCCEQEIPLAPATIVVGVPGQLIQRRPDLRRAERELAAQSAKIGIAASELYPHIGISGNIGLRSVEITRLFTVPGQNGNIGPIFDWNILNYGRIKANVGAENALFNSLLFAYCQKARRAQEETENAISDFLNERQRYADLMWATSENQKAADLVMLQFERGLVDYERVYEIQQLLVLVQEEMAVSRGKVALFAVQIYKSLGGGFGPAVDEDINAELIPLPVPIDQP